MDLLHALVYEAVALHILCKYGVVGFLQSSIHTLVTMNCKVNMA